MIDEILNYSDLQKEVHHALRAQHPEWVEPGGESPICDSYEARLAELLRLFVTEENRAIRLPRGHAGVRKPVPAGTPRPFIKT